MKIKVKVKTNFVKGWCAIILVHGTILPKWNSLVKNHAKEQNTKKKKKNYGPFLWMGFNWLKTRATSRRQFTFYHYVPRNSCYSCYRPRKDESILEPASGFEHGTPRWGIQRLNQWAIAQNPIGNNCANLTWKQLCHVPGL